MSYKTEDQVQAETAADNPFKTVNRYKKARAIADTLIGLGVTDVSPEPTEEQLTVWANMAKQHVPSLTTWALVRYLLQEGR